MSRGKRVLGFRSQFEHTISQQLATQQIQFTYEDTIIQYTIPERIGTYHPDFRLPNGIFVETKGRFLASDRKKHLLVRASNPGLDVRFLFMNSKQCISKKSKTTYADWCRKHNFKYADKIIPKDWCS